MSFSRLAAWGLGGFIPLVLVSLGMHPACVCGRIHLFRFVFFKFSFPPALDF